MGGAEYEIHGKGFAPEVGSNTIIFDQDRNYHLYTGPFVAQPTGKTYFQLNHETACRG